MASPRREHGRHDDELLDPKDDHLAHGLLNSGRAKLIVGDGEALAVEERLEFRGERFKAGPIGIRLRRSRPLTDLPVQFHLLGRGRSSCGPPPGLQRPELRQMFTGVILGDASVTDQDDASHLCARLAEIAVGTAAEPTITPPEPDSTRANIGRSYGWCQ